MALQTELRRALLQLSLQSPSVSAEACPCVCAGTALAAAVLVPNVEFIFGLTGSTASVVIAYMLPAAVFLALTGRPGLLNVLNPEDLATGAAPAGRASDSVLWGGSGSGGGGGGSKDGPPSAAGGSAGGSGGAGAAWRSPAAQPRRWRALPMRGPLPPGAPAAAGDLVGCWPSMTWSRR